MGCGFVGSWLVGLLCFVALWACGLPFYENRIEQINAWILSRIASKIIDKWFVVNQRKYIQHLTNILPKSSQTHPKIMPTLSQHDATDIQQWCQHHPNIIPQTCQNHANANPSLFMSLMLVLPRGCPKIHIRYCSILYYTILYYIVLYYITWFIWFIRSIGFIVFCNKYALYHTFCKICNILHIMKNMQYIAHLQNIQYILCRFDHIPGT